jgi:GTP pyrophosphokinase
MTVATERFLDALSYATRIHGADLRKGTSVPYVAHLLGVCALVLADRGTEDEAIAALLHDTLEDHPEEVDRTDIARRFGTDVLAIIEACTDTPIDYKGGPKPPWRERKTAYVGHVGRVDALGRRVALADKLDNVRSVVADYRDIGESIWKRFNAGQRDQLWFYRALARAFREGGATGFLVEEFERTVSELESLAGASAEGTG